MLPGLRPAALAPRKMPQQEEADGQEVVEAFRPVILCTERAMKLASALLFGRFVTRKQTLAKRWQRQDQEGRGSGHVDHALRISTK